MKIRRMVAVLFKADGETGGRIQTLRN